MKKWIFCLFVCTVLGTACQSVKPYQRAFVNDHEMRLGKKMIHRFEGQVHVYREGASGGGMGKASGGCGCN